MKFPESECVKSPGRVSGAPFPVQVYSNISSHTALALGKGQIS